MRVAVLVWFFGTRAFLIFGWLAPLRSCFSKNYAVFWTPSRAWETRLVDTILPPPMLLALLLHVCWYLLAIGGEILVAVTWDVLPPCLLRREWFENAALMVVSNRQCDLRSQARPFSPPERFPLSWTRSAVKILLHCQNHLLDPIEPLLKGQWWRRTMAMHCIFVTRGPYWMPTPYAPNPSSAISSCQIDGRTSSKVARPVYKSAFRKTGERHWISGARWRKVFLVRKQKRKLGFLDFAYEQLGFAFAA